LYLFAIVISEKQADNTKLVKDIVQCEQSPDDLGSRDELARWLHAGTLRSVGPPRKTLLRTRP
jgi:hypothetical protein